MTTVDSMLRVLRATDVMDQENKDIVQRQILQGLFDQIAGKDKEIVGKEELAASLTKARDELQQTRDELLQTRDELLQDKIDLKQKLAETEGKRRKIEAFSALSDMRPLLERCVGVLWSQISNATARVNKLQSLLFVNGDYKNGPLTQEAINIMKELETKVESGSTNDLRDLYHELSKDHHDIHPNLTGFVCAGSKSGEIDFDSNHIIDTLQRLLLEKPKELQ
jgi:hypothetical protein